MDKKLKLFRCASGLSSFMQQQISKAIESYTDRQKIDLGYKPIQVSDNKKASLTLPFSSLQFK